MRLSFRRREMPPLAAPRACAAAVALPDGRVAILGGRTRGSELPKGGECEERCWSSTAVDLVDVARGVSAVGPALLLPREGAKAALWGGRVALLGGLADHG